MRMNKKLTVTAIACLILGVVICLVALVLSRFDFGVLNSVGHESKTYEIEEEFVSVEINANTENVVFLPSDNGKCSIVCFENDKEKHEVSVESGTLTVSVNDSRKWYECLGFYFGDRNITVYLPEMQYNSLKIGVKTGNINVTGIKTERIEFSVNTGSIALKNVVAEEKFIIKCGTGRIKLQDCDAADISIQVSTGSVTGTLLSAKVFDCKTSTGRVTVPKSTSGGICEITVSTGDIKIEIKNQ